MYSLITFSQPPAVKGWLTSSFLEKAISFWALNSPLFYETNFFLFLMLTPSKIKTE